MWSLSQDLILQRVTNWNSIPIIQPQNCWNNSAVYKSTVHCTVQCCSLQSVCCIKRMAALTSTTTKWPSHLSFERQITSCNEECWLLTTLERKRKKAEGKYRLIRSNWDPAGYPFRPLMEENKKKDNELKAPQAGWTCLPVNAVRIIERRCFCMQNGFLI